MIRYLALPTLALAALTALAPAPALAQGAPDLLLPAQASSAATRRDVPARRARKVRVDASALAAAELHLHLFDDVQLTLTRAKARAPKPDSLVWIGKDDYGAQAVLTAVKGVLTGTVFADNRTFEIALEPDGQYSVAELDPASFPTDDPVTDGLQFEVLNDPANDVVDAEATVAPTRDQVLDGTPVMVDVMILWTPKAETAAGGPAAMESLALNAIENANLVYANSGVNAQLRLAYAASVSYTETPSNISTDLNAIRSNGDGVLDQVHSLRSQYAADIVSLFGEGYRNYGACGVGSLMSTLTTSFASYAFNVVDRACAVGNLSFAHEVGHNEGLHHDPANASSTPAFPYAYGYQDPSGYFRTLLSYGSATRVPYLSSPDLLYSGRVTGTSSQDNMRALSATIATVAAFQTSTTTEPPPTTPTTCTYTLSTSSLSFSANGGSKSVTVTTSSGCAWDTSNDTSASWVSMSAAGGTGSASVTVSVQANTSSARSTTVTIAGNTVAVNQNAAKGAGRGKK